MIRYKSLNIKEARRNPEQNPFIGAWDYLEQYKDDPNVYISFTDVDKIGINPQSGFNTPLGIYTYPLKEFIEEYVDINQKEIKSIGGFAPFAGSSKYINFLKLIDKSHFVSDMYKDYGSNDYDKDIKILEKKYKKHMEDNVWGDMIPWSSFINDANRQAKAKNSVMSMWNITRMLAQQLTTTPKAASTKWNLILSKDLGYAGFADKSGKGYIHPSEPTQAVFLRKNAFNVLHRVENIPVKSKVNRKTLNYFLKNLDKVDDSFIEEDILNFIRLDPLRGYKLIGGMKNPPENFLIKAIKIAPQVINMVSEKAQISLIKENPIIITYINKPSENVQQTLVKKDGELISYLENPSEKTQLIAVNQNLGSITNISNPTEKVQLFVIKKDLYKIPFVKNPTEKVQLMVIKKDLSLIRSIENPTPKVIAFYQKNKNIKKESVMIRYKRYFN